MDSKRNFGLLFYYSNLGGTKDEKRITIFVVLIILAAFMSQNISLGNNSIFAQAGSAQLEEKTYCQTTLEDNFADDTISIVLTKDATYSFKKYTPSCFSALFGSS